MRALVSASSEALYTMSPDWAEMRQLAGGGFLPDTGGPNRAWLDKHIHPDDQPRVAAAIYEAVQARGHFRARAPGPARGRGSGVDAVAGGANPGRGRRGAGWFGAASDVTARKEAEAVLCEANAPHVRP